MITDTSRIRPVGSYHLQLLAFAFSAACGSDAQEMPGQSAAGTGTAGTPSQAGSSAGRSAAGSVSTGAGGVAGSVRSTAGTGSPVAGTTGGSSAAGSGGTPSPAAAGSGGASAGSTGSAGAATAGAGGPTTPDAACNPADKLPDATPVTGIGTGEKPTGMFATVVESDPGIADQTIFRPEPLGMIKHPVFTWGNGGCMKSNSGFSEFLLQIAAEGIVVIADGKPSATGSSDQKGDQLIKAIDWAEKENERPCSKYYHKLDLGAIAVSGQSCGGLMALNASDDKRVTLSMPMNSGLMAADATLYAALHAPMAIINGGSTDIAYDFGNQTFDAITNIPIMIANIDVGHGGTYREDNGGEMGKFARAWLRWHLLKDEGATGKGMFIGDTCGFCGSGSMWEMKWKMKPM
jgi:hypothetical protein